ncbi:GDSL-type esterase/lipase family protein [Halopseudomonas laoshanensis]|uniref:GDSL-type esterase/lipase family protein n=1 Tax=Halopseudomonas laoshanensis TaxID=2268758 RepID=UPI0037368D93
MAHNTGNPSGSEDPRDFIDNAADIDEWATSEEKLMHPDRLGKPRKTFKGMNDEFEADQAERASDFTTDQDARATEFSGDQAARESAFDAAQTDKLDRFNAFIASSGYVGTGEGGVVEDYTAGIEVTEYNQIIRADGELWHLSAQVDLPYTTTGLGMPESDSFVSVGDAALRQQLASPTGAEQIGFGAGTVAERLGSSIRTYVTIDAMVADASLSAGQMVAVSENPGKACAATSLYKIASAPLAHLTTSSSFNGYLLANGLVASPEGGVQAGQTAARTTVVLDARARALKNTGWHPEGEIGGVAKYATTALVSAGALVIPVTNAANYKAGQLLTFQDLNGAWKSAVVKSISGNNISLKSGVETQLPSGAAVVNFYNDQSHPNFYGFRCIADYAVLDAARAGKVLASDMADLFEVTGAVKTLVTENAPSMPAAPYYSVTAGGLRSRVYGDTGGVRVSVVAGTVGAGEIKLTISEREQDSAFYSIKNATAQTDGGVVKLEVEFASALGSEWYATVSSTVQFVTGPVEVRESIAVNDLNNGKHVLLGDSWFVLTGIFERISSLLPSARIVNKGVGGNRSDQLLARFYTDVELEKPNYVWIICGTNDNGQGTPVQTTNSNMKQLIRRVKDIGAVPLVFSPWVGYGAFETPSANLSQSNYLRESRPLPSSDVSVSYDITLAAGEERVVYLGIGSERDFIIKESVQKAVVGVDMRAGFSGAVGIPVSNVVTYPTSELILSKAQYKRIESLGEGSPRQRVVSVKNATAATVQIVGTLKIGSYLA